jgi:ATP adenylyltransferase
MKALWAPWRMEYIVGPKEQGCIFCTLPNQQKDRDNLILYRGKECYVIMNRYPYNNGHLMVVPYFHTSSFDGLTDDVLAEMNILTKRCVDCLKKAFNPEGFNVGINIGRAAGAGIEEHLHVHVVPRWGGDANFMTVVGELRVIVEHIMVTYDKLFPVFHP